MKKIKVLILLLFTWAGVLAQQGDNQIIALQDSLIKIAKAANEADGDVQKLEINGHFVKTLVEALKTSKSFNFPFDSLKNVSVIKSPDQAFRILSWYLPLADGTYRFYGTVQMNTNNGPLKLFPLIDRTEILTDQNVITDNQKWFGARYYEIVPIKSGNRLPYYVLLGWKGNSSITTKKVIEILSFTKDGISFGAPVFDGKDYKDKNRVIFEYVKANAMTLKTDQKAAAIVFDHLAPYDTEMVGKFEYYASDGTTDGFKIIGGKLKFFEGLELNNNANAMDELYADPKKNVKPIRKF